MLKTRSPRSTMLGLILAAAAALALAACGDDEAAPADQPIAIQFAAVVGAEPFACGATYTLGVGNGGAGSTFQPRDLRFYVSDVTLLYHDGSEAPLAMAEDGNYQRAGVALLDFEDGTAACAAGSEGAVGDAGTHTAVTGRAPAGHVHGLRFTVGVPEEMNHLDAASAAPPLNRTAMFWSWTTGYRHLRIDGNITNVGAPNVHNLHVGSTGCALLDPADPSKGAVCNTSNRPVVYLADVDLATQAVTLDLQALFATADLDGVGLNPSPGCMSGPTDPECGPIFQKLGLPFGTAPAGQQQVFRAQ